jgi:hypothetical protein
MIHQVPYSTRLTLQSLVCLEAVSPVLKAGTQSAEDELLLFWEAMRKVFKVQKNFSCGSHVHVTPPGKRYTISQLRSLAWAVVVSENNLLEYMPPERRQSNSYCRRNSEVSPTLRIQFQAGRSGTTLAAIRTLIRNAQTPDKVFEIMQGTGQGARYVVWNFKNTVGQGSGTIEYRGGRHLRGPNRALWWVTFAVAFVSMSIREASRLIPAPLIKLEALYLSLTDP